MFLGGEMSGITGGTTRGVSLAIETKSSQNRMLTNVGSVYSKTHVLVNLTAGML